VYIPGLSDLGIYLQSGIEIKEVTGIPSGGYDAAQPVGGLK